LLKSIRRFFHTRDTGPEEFDWETKNRELVALLNARKVGEALIVGQELLDYVDDTYKKDAAQKATTYNNMGMTFLLSKDYPLAEQCFHNALTMRKRMFGEHHNEVAVILLNLSQLYKIQAQEIMALNPIETTG
jgi:tetratricopeptide (TPR) repeat protein